MLPLHVCEPVQIIVTCSALVLFIKQDIFPKDEDMGALGEGWRSNGKEGKQTLRSLSIKEFEDAMVAVDTQLKSLPATAQVSASPVPEENVQSRFGTSTKSMQ